MIKLEENNKICYLTRLSGKTNPSSLKKREKVRRGWKQKGGQKAINFMTQNFKLASFFKVRVAHSGGRHLVVN